MRENWNQIIKEICQEENIIITQLPDDWFLELKKKDKVRYLLGYTTNLNSAVVARTCNDKCATSNLLDLYHIPNVHHLLVENNNDIWKNLESLLHQYKRIVCKPVSGSGGKLVFKADNFSEAQHVANQILEKERAFVVCPYYEIKKEYRVVILDGEIKLIFSKIRNNNSWKCNLVYGAEPQIEEIKMIQPYIQNYIDILYHKLNLRFASVDFIQDEEDNFRILEINNDVTLEHFAEKSEENYLIAKQIYKEAVLKMFK